MPTACPPLPSPAPAELAPECADAYCRYGSALLYQAQDNADVFGGPIRGGGGNGTDKENADAPEDEEAAEAPGEDDEGADAAEPADVKGKGPAQPKEPSPEAADGEGEGDGAEGDLQLAWENLETARAIWAKNADSHREHLARELPFPPSAHKCSLSEPGPALLAP